MTDKEAYSKYREKILARKKLYYIANREDILAKRKLEYVPRPRKTSKQDPKVDLYKRLLWRKANPDKVASYYKKYKRENPSIFRVRWSKRRADKIRRTPKWLSKDQLKEIERIYRDCPAGYHVDHIVPLCGKNISGLHVPWNLQYLPAKENLKKGNRF